MAEFLKVLWIKTEHKSLLERLTIVKVTLFRRLFVYWHLIPRKTQKNSQICVLHLLKKRAVESAHIRQF